MVIHPTHSNADAARQTSPGSVALFCSEALRPSACCVVDALEIRGYTTRLWTGRNAGLALQRSRRRFDADLRVVFAPEALDADVHKKILRGLDPAARGDVLVLAFDRPCDAIAAIERATGRAGPRPPRTRPSRAVLAHPTLVESKLELRRWVPPVLAGTATFAALTAAMVIATPSPATTPSEPLASAPTEAAVAAPAPTTHRRDDVTFASTRMPAFSDGDDDSFDMELERAFEERFDEPGHALAMADIDPTDGLEGEGEDENEDEDVIIIEDDDTTSVRQAANAATDALYRRLATDPESVYATGSRSPDGDGDRSDSSPAPVDTPSPIGEDDFDASILLEEPVRSAPTSRVTVTRSKAASAATKTGRQSITLADPFAL